MVSQSKHHQLNIDNRSLEQESSVLLKTTQNVILFYKQTYKLDEIIDYSPIIIGIGKIFEKEINLTVVHWVRKKLNVDLLNFFNKYETGKQSVFVSSFGNTSKSSDFNKGNTYKWIPPGIGESENVVNKLFLKEDCIENFNPRMEDRLIKSWTKIRCFRNNSAHIDIADFKAYNSMVDEFNGLSKENIFLKLFDLKDFYSGKDQQLSLNIQKKT